MENFFVFEGETIEGELIYATCERPMNSDELAEYAKELLVTFGGGHIDIYDSNDNFLFDVEI